MSKETKTLTIRQIARAVGFSTVAIRHWCKWGILPCEKMRGRLFIQYPDTGLRIETNWTPGPGYVPAWTPIAKKKRISLARALSDQNIPVVTFTVRSGKKMIEVYRPDRIK
jgi:hypothetical protein